MNLNRRSFLAGLLGGAAAGCSRPATPLRRAVAYLLSKQSKDGGWHSETYGLLRSGQSLTPFVLDALMRVPGAAPAGAIEFIRRSIGADGAVGRGDPASEDYPNYATSLAVLALSRAQQPVGPLVEYLRRQQFTEETGWRESDPPYGGWGMGGERRIAPHPGHVDLSMTRHVLQALAAAGVKRGDPVFERARVFLKRCQNPDGGFFFSPVVLDANKAGEEDGRFRSYGTTTADGILSLQAIGESADLAKKWLAARHRGADPPGFEEPSRRRYAEGLRFYYAAACAEIGIRVELPGQRADGSWANPEPLVKEDDPLIATAFAVRALCQKENGTADKRR